MECDLFLAVDLDGTFLGGSEQDRRSLYGLIEAHRDRVVLAFVTGRDIAFASGLCAGCEVPAPNLIIGDVGTSVVVGPDWVPHAAVEAWIDSKWQGCEAATAIMARRPRLRPQPVVGGRRLSFFYEEQEEADAAALEIVAAGYDALCSANLYFDVLPRGVSKGATLMRVLEHMNLPKDRVLTAGDTLNDLSLFQTGLKGVAVGNSESRLRRAVESMDNVYKACAAGCGGILEALEYFRLTPTAS